MARSNHVVVAGSNSAAHLQDLLKHLVALQQRSLAESSRRQYRITWGQWCNFCSQLGVSVWLPATQLHTHSIRLALFTVYCWLGRLPSGRVSAASVRSKLSHVRWYHRLYADCDPQLTPSHGLVLAGMQRIKDRLDPSNALHRVIGGAALLGFFFLRRSTEYLAVKGTRRNYTLLVGDVKIRDVRGRETSSHDLAATVEVDVHHFRGSKNDQTGSGTTRRLGRSGHDTLCPVRAALVLRHHAASIGATDHSPLCRVSRVEMLSADTLAKVLRRASAATGTDPTRISCHSLRCGGATALLSAGVDSTLVMLHGRWRSDAFQRYTRYNRQTSADLAMRMAGTST
ncbi:hypothetical protein PHYSODRAFT_491167 [Phytophthora sojae]|uniref:Tyr recombinase domain-containing protein n=1 Tax=Phytophthora sojae (strain P6497) TaxID=1094619 RepID=G4Z4I2_PHYSP|nr:hypothetical protein PHYSODRAFT_491167 [Phytophthora sojae]EGZ20185.1 hypothetical protein PHYSODRAFT_491167 [Phytophthora sojae]|eukprot:XP_009522902.1 hypothetical protein PHYSODRAFT_491167 [Phytophthora sojae]